MEIETARAFLLKNPDALRKDHPLHNRWLLAQEEVRRYRETKLGDLSDAPKVLDNPRWGRMRR